MPPLEVVFHKGPSRRYRSVLRRADGVCVELDGGPYNRIGEPRPGGRRRGRRAAQPGRDHHARGLRSRWADLDAGGTVQFA